MLETKATNEMTARDVQAKCNAAATWCRHAGDFACRHGGKPWHYVLIPHNAVAENMTLSGLAVQFTVAPPAVPRQKAP